MNQTRRRSWIPALVKTGAWLASSNQICLLSSLQWITVPIWTWQEGSFVPSSQQPCNGDHVERKKLVLTFGVWGSFSSLTTTLVVSSATFSLVEDAEIPFSSCSNSFSNLDQEETSIVKHCLKLRTETLMLKEDIFFCYTALCIIRYNFCSC